MIAAIGGYFYIAVPMQQTPDTNQDQGPLAATPESVPSQPSLPTVDNPVPKVSPEALGRDIPMEDIQEADAAQILALAEEQVLERKRFAGQSAPPTRGDRKTARAANERGLAALQSGRIQEAVSAFWDARQADPADVEVLNNLGHAYLMQGDLQSAERYILTTLALAAQRTAAWSDLGQVYGKNGDTRGAVAS